MITGQIIYKDNHLTFRKSGKNQNVLLLFHGFGQDHSAFDEWVQLLTERFTIYSFDLFYHGESSRSDSGFTKKIWHSLLDKFLDAEHINRFSLAGFSLGGRFVLSAAIQFQDRIESILLTAPDGFYQSIWYRFATHTIMQRVFKFYMEDAIAFDRMVRRMELLHFVNPALAKFVKYELGKPENRMRVYRSWVYFKPLLNNKAQLIRFFKSINFPVQVILGEKDRIIQPKSVLKILLDTPVDIHVLNIRHHELIDANHLGPYLEKL